MLKHCRGNLIPLFGKEARHSPPGSDSCYVLPVLYCERYGKAFIMMKRALLNRGSCFQTRILVLDEGINLFSFNPQCVPHSIVSYFSSWPWYGPCNSRNHPWSGIHTCHHLHNCVSCFLRRLWRMAHCTHSHRLNTIMASDRILVMDAGKVFIVVLDLHTLKLNDAPGYWTWFTRKSPQG